MDPLVQPQPKPAARPGFKTSEAASLLAYAALVALNKKLTLDVSDEVLMTLGGAVVSFIAQRGWVKR